MGKHSPDCFSGLPLSPPESHWRSASHQHSRSRSTTCMAWAMDRKATQQKIWPACDSAPGTVFLNVDIDIDIDVVGVQGQRCISISVYVY